MKLIATGDLHVHVNARWAQCLQVLRFIRELVQTIRPQLFVVTGDIYERASVPAERDVVAEWLQAIGAVCPVLIVKGNHDPELECKILGRLESVHPIVVEEGAGVHVFGDMAIAAMAWPSREALLASAHAQGAPAELTAQDALRDVLRGLGDQLAASGCKHRLAAGHWMVDGSVTSVGQPLVGVPMSVGLSDLSLLQAQLVLMGHVHKPQHWTLGHIDYVYCGSPHRTSWGEVEDKSVVLVDSEAPELWSRVITPSPAMHLIHERFVEGDFEGFPEAWLPENIVNAEIRLRYDVQLEDREAARACAQRWVERLKAAGAAVVKTEEVVLSQTRARAPEIAKLTNLPDKLLALWQARGTTPEADRRKRLLAMLCELEEREP